MVFLTFEIFDEYISNFKLILTCVYSWQSFTTSLASLENTKFHLFYSLSNQFWSLLAVLPLYVK